MLDAMTSGETELTALYSMKPLICQNKNGVNKTTNVKKIKIQDQEPILFRDL